MSWDLTTHLQDLETKHLRRSLRTVESPQSVVITTQGRELVNFSSNDYLGLANSPALRKALHEGVELYGAGSGASRLVCGSLTPHLQLEAAIAQFKGTEAALAFSSGYAVALGTLPALMKDGDVIILDKLCHASLVDAARLSGATIRVFPHNHLGKLERLLRSSEGKRTLVVTESIFSMDGDSALLAEMIELKDRHGAWILVDEAHAVGVTGPQGRGLGAALGLEQRIDLQMGTFSKAVGLSGGYLAASNEVIDTLINQARSFIYSTAPPPCVSHAACEALRIISSAEGDALRCRLQDIKSLLYNQLSSTFGELPVLPAAIIPIIIGDENEALQISARLREAGLLIPAIRYPTVARGSARLRITLSAAHESAHITTLVDELNAIRTP